jgi:hypothetical protein
VPKSKDQTDTQNHRLHDEKKYFKDMVAVRRGKSELIRQRENKRLNFDVE